jgi:anti-sigma-K factor RskA
MPSEWSTLEALSRPIIAQCRREVDLGWQHVEAARAVLAKSRWLMARWETQLAAIEAEIVTVAPRAEMFVFIEEPKRAAKRRHSRRKSRLRPARAHAVLAAH